MSKKVAGLSTLSRHAVENVNGVDYWEPLVTASVNAWSPTNPDGLVELSVAENCLMREELQKHIKQNFGIDPDTHFTYGVGPSGSPRLRKALSELFNDFFSPVLPVNAGMFLLSTGLTAMLDHVTWAICNEGEGILIPQPLYPGFTNDLPVRARGRLVPVPFTREDGHLDLNDVFDADANTRCLERAYRLSTAQGVKIRGVMITNPHNPLGKCYSPKTIKAIAAFCAKYGLHYLSDEIYALSTFENPAYPNAVPFHSVLSVDLHGTISPNLVHVLYGMSKDFCCNGLRLGVLCSSNEAMRLAIAGIIAFGWQAYLVQDIWAKMLEDRPFLNRFIAENRKRLAARHLETTQLLARHKVAYFAGGNAGFFLWLDFRRELCGISKDSDKEQQRLAPLHGRAASASQEEDFAEDLSKRGVLVNQGLGCLSEEPGWVRIVFTIDEEPWRLGLQRMLDGLSALKALQTQPKRLVRL